MDDDKPAAALDYVAQKRQQLIRADGYILHMKTEEDSERQKLVIKRCHSCLFNSMNLSDLTWPVAEANV